jgi:hypothetical protein
VRRRREFKAEADSTVNGLLSWVLMPWYKIALCGYATA